MREVAPLLQLKAAEVFPFEGERALTRKGQPHGKDASPTACLDFGVISYGRTESRGHK